MKAKQILSFAIMLECGASYAFFPKIIQDVVQSTEDSLVTAQQGGVQQIDRKIQQQLPQTAESTQGGERIIDGKRNAPIQNNGEGMSVSESPRERRRRVENERRRRQEAELEEQREAQRNREAELRKDREELENRAKAAQKSENDRRHLAYQNEVTKNHDRIEAMASLTKELTTYLQGEFTNKLNYVCKIHDQLLEIAKTSNQQDLLCLLSWGGWTGPLASRVKIFPPSEYLIKEIFREAKGKIGGLAPEDSISFSIVESKSGMSIEEIAPNNFRVNDIVFQLWNGQHYALSFRVDDLTKDGENVAKLSTKMRRFIKEWLDTQHETACAFGEKSVWNRYFAQTHKEETAPVKILKEIALGDSLIEVLKKISRMDPSFEIALHDGEPTHSFTGSSQDKRPVTIPPMAYGRQYDFKLKNHTLTFGFGGFDSESAVNLLWAKVAFNTGSVEVEKLEELLAKRFPKGFALSKNAKKVGMHWKDPENTPQFIGERYANAMVIVGMSTQTRKEGGELLKSEQNEYDRALKTMKEIQEKYMEPTYVYRLEARHSGYTVVVNTLEKVPGIASDYIAFDLDTHNLQIDLYNTELRKKAEAAQKEEQEKSKKDAEAALDI